MYKDYYGLQSDPFRLSPDHAFCLPHRSFAKAKAYMRYAMHRSEGFVMITGAPGTGKTTLIDDLLAETGDSEFSVARLVSVQVEADDILRMVAAEFGLAISESDKSETLRLLSRQFTNNFKQGKRSLLIVDEAQGLGLSALEELRLLTNLRIGGQPMLQIFLVGQEELRDMVTSPELEQLNQRMIAAYHMEPLKPDEFLAYVLHRLKVAGWIGNPGFAADLFPALFRFSNGLPRRINHICSRLLLHGYLEEKVQLDAADMEIVIRELRAEHYSIKENSALITQDKFNPEDLRQMAQAALSEQTAAVSALPAETVQPLVAEAEADQQSGIIDAKMELDQHMVSPSDSEQLPKHRVKRERVQSLKVNRYSGLSEGEDPTRARGVRIPTWGIALTMAVGGFLVMLLVSLPTQQLHGLASQSLWNSIGLTRVRTQVGSWSGGRLPLQPVDGYAPPPVPPAAIERDTTGNGQDSGEPLEKMKTAAEPKDDEGPVPESNKEIFGEAALVSRD